MAPHFLVVTIDAQGHVNPALHLCRRLASSAAAASVTFSTTISGHRRMFPASADKEVHDGLISYIPFSNGYDDGFNDKTNGAMDYKARTRSFGYKTLSAVVRSLADCGRPVNCIIYNMLLSWVSDVARDHGISSAAYWIQSATVFAVYYHYFHGHDGLIKAHSRDPHFQLSLPGMSPIKIRDVPSFLLSSDPDDPYAPVFEMFRDLFDELDRVEATGTQARVLVNTFDELEPDALVAAGKVKLIPIGPVVTASLVEGGGNRGEGGDLFKADEKLYMEWLDSKPERSVVYMSFGSLSVVKKRLAKEILQGLRASGRPYLWVVRKDNRGELEEDELRADEEEGRGMVVEWCSQLRVLSHKAVGCFVTHCGWNSTLESLVCGVPTVAVPLWTDQAMNARLMEMWGTGVRSEMDKDSVLEGEELRRCLEVVMGEGERGEEMRGRASMWKEKAGRAAGPGGSSDHNLRAFMDELASSE